jgi:RNA polymerase sigma factor (sigma-70 family)
MERYSGFSVIKIADDIPWKGREFYWQGSRFPGRLYKEDQRDLFRQYKQADDPELKRKLLDTLVMGNMWYLIRFSKKYAWSGVEVEDLVNAAVAGLIRSFKHYDPDRGVALLTFADPYLRSEIGLAISERTRLFYTPMNIRYKLDMLRNHFRDEMPTLHEIKDFLGDRIGSEEEAELVWKSFYAEKSPTQEFEPWMSGYALDPDLERAGQVEDQRQLIDRLLRVASLTHESREIFLKYYGLDDETEQLKREDRRDLILSKYDMSPTQLTSRINWIKTRLSGVAGQLGIELSDWIME